MMSYIKNNIRIFIFLLLSIIIGSLTFYYNNILVPQLRTVETLKKQNEIKKSKVQLLGQEFNIFSERESELIETQMHIKALSDRIPTYDSSMVIMMEMIQYMEIYNFQDLEINMGHPIKEESAINHYYKVPLTIKYTTHYNDIVDFLEEINRSYQMAKIEYLKIDNDIQEQIDEIESPVICKDLITTEMMLWLYYTDNKDVETYSDFMVFSKREVDVFLRPSAEE